MHIVLLLFAAIVLFLELVANVEGCGYYDEYGNFWAGSPRPLPSNSVYHGRRRRATPYECALQSARAFNSVVAWPGSGYNNGFSFNGRKRRAVDASGQSEYSFGAAEGLSQSLLHRILSPREELQ